MQAKVTDILSTGYAEVAVLDEQGNPGKERLIAKDEQPKKQKARRGDIVEIIPIRHQVETNSRSQYFYILPVILFAVGYTLSKDYSTPEKLLTGAILAVMGFVAAWILNRKARLSTRQEYKVTKIIKKDENLIH